MTSTEELERLLAEATQTPFGWWLGEPYSCSIRALGEPESKVTFPPEPDDNPDDCTVDIWAGDPNSEDDNTPLIAEVCSGPKDAALIVAAVNALPELLARVRRLEAENTALKDLCLAAGDLYKGGGVFPIKGTMALRLLKAGAALNQEPGQ